jgi:O-antigen ligase
VHDVPEAVICAGCVLMPLVVLRGNSDPWVLPRVALLWVLLVVCVGVIGVVLAVRPVPAWQIRPCWSVDIPLGATAGLIGASTVLSVDVTRSVIGDRGHYQGALTFLLYGASFMIARACLVQPGSVRRLWTAIVAGSIPVAGYAVAQRLGIDPLWGDDIGADRAFATFGQPNALAAYLALCVPLSIGLALDRDRRTRTLAIVAGAIGTIALVMTGSRGGLLALLGGAVVVAVTTMFQRAGSARRRERTMSAAVAAGAVAVGLMTLVWFGGLGAARDGIAPIREDGDSSIDDHLSVWRVAVDVAITNPLFGTGPDTFPDVFPTSSRRVLAAERVDHLDQFRVESPHNLFLATAAGSGILAMVALAAFFVGVATTLLQADRRRSRGEGASCPLLGVALGSLTAFLIAHQFISADLTSSWLILLVVGSGVGRAGRDPRFR